MALIGWTKFERGILESRVFCHPEDVRIYLWISNHAMVKDGVVVGDRVLKRGQYVQAIRVIQDKLWFYDGKKKDVYSSSRIQRSIKRLEKAGLITAEKFKHGYLFTVREAKDPTLDPQSVDITENEEETIDTHRQEKDAGIILASRCESDIRDVRTSSGNINKNVKNVENEKKKTLTTLTNTMADKLTLITEHFLVRRGGSFSLSPVDQMALEKISLHEMTVDELKAFMDEQFEKIKVHEPNATIHSPKYLLKALERRESPGKRMDELEEMLDRLEESLKDYDKG
jgi:polyhydroxyalkanoate synthesis regulator phasin